MGDRDRLHTTQLDRHKGVQSARDAFLAAVSGEHQRTRRRRRFRLQRVSVRFCVHFCVVPSLRARLERCGRAFGNSTASSFARAIPRRCALAVSQSTGGKCKCAS